MEWISVKDRMPLKENSPILACREAYDDYLRMAALHWLDNGWDGPGWCDHSDEYGMKEEEITHWMPLPLPPNDIG